MYKIFQLAGFKANKSRATNREISNSFIIIYFFNILAMNTTNTWLRTLSPLNSFLF